MNSTKWREVTIPREIIIDRIATHLYEFRVSDNRDITELEIPALMDIPEIQIKYKLKEVKKPVDQSGEMENAKMA